MSRHFAILMPSPPAMPAAGVEDEESRLQTGLTGRILSGPGLWLEWLEEIDRRALAGEFLAEGIIDQAVATAPHGHQLDQALNAKTTLLCFPAGCLFPGEGYDRIFPSPSACPALDLKARHSGSRRPVVRRSTGHAAGTLAAPYGRPTLLDAN